MSSCDTTTTWPEVALALGGLGILLVLTIWAIASIGPKP